MDFFEKLGDTISSKSKQVAQKAKDLAEISKLNGQVSTEEDVIKNAYIAIGKMYYEVCKEHPEDEYAIEVEAIKNANEKIKALQEQIHQLKGIINCTVCGAEIPVDASFCSSCGVKVEKVEVESFEGVVEDTDCSACGEPENENDVNDFEFKNDVETEEEKLQEESSEDSML
ncbi:zinc ribbon domain-containing protein [Anaeromicropila herbilytica]|uniref:DZANK-type domain-containing protein n=1 Tax=Anaeromicropila herbilytica TaxID=2785025 RepID=A0A7R7EM99_9FIRM|nr:zinc ribbon domain-containing protein [Anaeromicropila herbilytica]BCN31434.1 hypothetical protein bsdtb5_27290 [Anaeromicropila herbilytica]